MQIKHIVAKNILSRSKIGDFNYAINAYTGCPHACIYCYAEFMRKISNHAEKWGEFIDIKEFDEGSLVKFKQNYNGEKVFMSSVTDCYNPLEAKFKKTRKTLEILAYSEVKLQILTKSRLVLRDIDLLSTMPNVRVGFSVCVTDENLRRIFEPRASRVDERLAALAALRAHGIKTFLFVAPIFPQITPAVKIAREYGGLGDEICFDRLNLYPTFRDRILSFIGRNFPDLLALYKQIYLFNDNSYWSELKDVLVRELSGSGAKFDIFFD